MKDFLDCRDRGVYIEVFLREFASELTTDQGRKLTEMGIDLSIS